MATELTKDKIRDEVYLEMLKKRSYRTRNGKLLPVLQDKIQQAWDTAGLVADQAMAKIEAETPQ